jgi:subtilisin family serine protease
VGLADGPARTARALQAGPGGWGLDAVRARRAWSALGTTGAGVRVGIIDSGIDAGHPALAGKVAGWRDVVAGGPEPYDDNGHGTHAAGVLAGGDGSRSLVGVAPGARLLVAKAISGDGTGLGSDMVAAAEWLADPDGDPATADSPQVISNSWAQMADSNDPWFRPLVRRWRSLGIVAVFAAGNKGPQAGTLGSPAGYPEALAVGAVGADRSVAGFSSRGPVAWQNPDGLGPAPGPIPKPDLAAPGVDIVSSVPGGGYRAASGTSMAAPHVAGVAALVRAANPSLTAPAAERILLSTAADLGAPGRDNLAGEGLVDALAATARATAGSRRAGPRRTLGRAPRRATVRLTLAQLRINHRISVAATARVGLLEVRLGMSASPSLLPAAARRPVLRLSAAQMKITQRIAQSALRHASAVERHVASSPPAPAATAAAPSVAAVGRVTLTARQLLVNQRIAQAALRRVARAERLARSSGMLPPGPAP